MSKNKKIIVANWKMNPETYEEAVKVFSSIKKIAKKAKNIKIVVCPPFVYLGRLKADSSVCLGSQNLYWKDSGPFTGEINAQMVKNNGASFSIIGHSERRSAGETDEDISKKIFAAAQNSISPIFCIGEKIRDQNGEYLEFLKGQIKNGLSKISSSMIYDIIIAYEPVFAIGRSFDQALKPNEVHEISIFIKKILTEMFGKEAAFSVPILYGGSVDFENAGGIIKDGEINGLLVGRESLNAEHFKGIIDAVK